MYAELLKLEELQAPALLGYVESKLAEIHHRRNYLGPTILPSDRVEDLSFEYIVGADRVPVAAHIVEYDSPSPVGRRTGRWDKVSGELLVSKVKLSIRPKELLLLRRALESNSREELKRAIRVIYDDVENVVAALAARVEWLRWQALATGKVLYNSDGIVVELDYHLPETNVFVTQTDWSDLDNATPLSDLMALCDAIEQATGVRPARAVCRLTTWNELIMNKKETKNWVHGAVVTEGGTVYTTNRPVTKPELMQLLTALNLPAFTTYDVKVRVEDPITKTVTEQYLIPENTVVLLPPSSVEVGRTLFGPTPTEVMDVAGYGTALRTLTEAPRYVVRIYEEGGDTPTIWTLGEVVAVPALPGINYVGILKTRTA